jgi:wyosine [tRNA(Phe)-imidazoG37] synthetase (radical SAM superfamily)
MACAGCGIKVAPPPVSESVGLEKSHLQNAKEILSRVRSALENNNYSFGMVEQSGGEPTHYPEIVEMIGEVYNDCVHKIITNGLPTASIIDYLKRRKDQTMVVLSLDHHRIEFNKLRLRAKYVSNPSNALQLHKKVLGTLDLLASLNVPVIVSTTISKWNIDHYVDFLGWLESKYPRHISEGMIVPIPVSLVSFGNKATGTLNPTLSQVIELEKSIKASKLKTVKRSREWLYLQLIGHYKQKMRHFLNSEQLKSIESSPSRHACEIYRYMISFNFQDEEILRKPEDSLFQGFVCGVKALGNIGFHLQEKEFDREAVLENRPSNLEKKLKYFRMSQIDDYLRIRERLIDGADTLQMGSEIGYFSDLRRGMCLLDDFDGVWWPINMYIQGFVDDKTLAEFCSAFRNPRLMSCLDAARKDLARKYELNRDASLEGEAGTVLDQRDAVMSKEAKRQID